MYLISDVSLFCLFVCLPEYYMEIRLCLFRKSSCLMWSTLSLTDRTFSNEYIIIMFHLFSLPFLADRDHLFISCASSGGLPEGSCGPCV